MYARSASELAILFHFFLKFHPKYYRFGCSLRINVLHGPDYLLVHDDLWFLSVYHNRADQ